MALASWEKYFSDTARTMFLTSKTVLDIGEGLRAREGRGNRFFKGHAWLQEYIARVEYKVMDPVADYKPDIVGDIHNIPLPNESIDAIFCLAVLEHVENPLRAMEEMGRVLREGGKMLIYVPFLYYYHAEEGYYGDYWRFTHDTLVLFGKPYKKYEIVPVRLPIETVTRITPLGRYGLFITLARFFDNVFYAHKKSKQVAGYYLYVEK
jgi:SAM-dependent methyltransferase